MQKGKTIILVLLAVCITLGILWYGHRPVILKKATHDDVLAGVAFGAGLHLGWIKGVPSVVFIDPSKKGIINRLLKR